MSVTARLIFDATDATTQAASANVGSWTRAGDDGTLIGHVSDALKVNFSNTSLAVTATDLDIRDLAFATDSVDVSGSAVSITGDVNVTQGTSPWVVSASNLDIRDLVFSTDKVDVSGSSVSISGSVTVTATNLDIRDLTAASDSVQAWAFDGTGNAITSTTGWLDVNIAGGTVNTSDAALANTAGANAAISVSTSGALVASPLSARKYLYAFNNGNKAVYLGFGTVSAANGFPMYPGQAYEFRAGASIAMNAFAASSQDVRTLELS
jgi:hypothetical protein